MGSIRKAAEHLNLTPSAMNRRIQDLEAEIGTALFERRPRGVKLTTAGEMFVRYARSQIADADRMRSHVEDLRGLRRGPVLMACSQALALDFLASRIAIFQKQHPKVTFDLKVMDHDRALDALAAYSVDLALIYRPATRPALRVIASIPQRLVAIVRSDHPGGTKDGKAVGMLAVSGGPAGSHTQWPADSRRSNHAARIALQCDG